MPEVSVRKVDIPRLKQYVDEEVEGKIGALIMATADELRAEGREEGLEEGRETLIQLTVLQLSQKFESLPTWVMQKVETASIDSLKRWMANILQKNSVEEIFT